MTITIFDSISNKKPKEEALKLIDKLKKDNNEDAYLLCESVCYANNTKTTIHYIVAHTAQVYYDLIQQKPITYKTEYGNGEFNTNETNRKNTLYEVIRNDTPKLYFDFDFKPNAITTQEFNTLLECFKDVLKAKLHITELELLIYIRNEPTTNTIRSSHIITPKYKMTKEQQKFLAINLNENYEEFSKLDTKIYSIDRHFNLPFHKKTNQANYKDRHFICYDEYTSNQSLDPTNYILDLTTNTTQLKYKDTRPQEAKKTLEQHITAKTLIKINTNRYNLVEYLIKHLPSEFYSDTNKLFTKLFKYLIIKNYNHKDFLLHSHIIFYGEHRLDILHEYTEKIKNAEYIHYEYVLYDLVKKYGLFFCIDSCLSSEFINFVNKITQADLTQQLEANEMEFIADATDKERPTIPYEHFTINIQENTILDNKNKTYYSEAQDRLNKLLINNDYKNICCKQITHIAQLGLLMDTIILDSNEDEPKQQAFIAKALYGSGKTKIIINRLLTAIYKYKAVGEPHTQQNEVGECETHFTTYNNHKKIKTLILTSNNALNAETHNKLKLSHPNLNISYHQNEFIIDTFKASNHNKTNEEKQDLQDTIDIYICSMESIITRQPINYYDVIVLDEYITLNDHYFSSTMIAKPNTNDGNNEYNKYQAIKKYIKKAKLVIMLDADIDYKSVVIAKEMLNKNVDLKCYYLQDNNFSDYTIYHYYDENHLLANFKNDINKKLKIAFCSSSSKQAERIYKFLTEQHKDLCVVLITGIDSVRLRKNGHEDLDPPSKQKYLSAIEKNTIDYDIDIMLYSPTITIGISIEAEYFHKLYFIGYSEGTPTARIASQMFFRNRRLKLKEIHIGYTNRVRHRAYVDREEIAKCYNIETTYSKSYNIAYVNHDEDKLFKLLYVNHRTNRLLSDDYYKQELLYILQSHNLKIINVYSNEKFKVKEFMEAEELLKQEKAINICCANTIDYETYNKLKDPYLVVDSEEERTSNRLMKAKYYIMNVSSYLDKPHLKAETIKEQLKNANTLTQYYKDRTQARIKYNENVYSYTRRHKIDKLISLYLEPIILNLNVDSNGYVKVDIVINTEYNASQSQSKIDILELFTKKRNRYERLMKEYEYITANHSDITETEKNNHSLKKDGLKHDDIIKLQTRALYSIYHLLDLNKHNNFTKTYTNASFREHINNHKETIKNNWDYYITLLKMDKQHFKHLEAQNFSNKVNLKDLVNSVKCFLNQIQISTINSSNEYSKSTIATNAKYAKLDSSLLTLSRHHQIDNIWIIPYSMTAPINYIYTTPYHIVKPITTSIKVIKNNETYRAITLQNNTYNETIFNKQHKLLTPIRNKFNINATQAKETNTKRVLLKEYNNETLHGINSVNTFTPTEDYNINTNIILRINEDGLLKSFVKIDVEKIYTKTEPTTYYTKDKQPIINIIKPTSGNANDNNFKNIHNHINGVIGALTIPKIDYTNFYTKYEYSELMKQRINEDIKKPNCKWFYNDTQRQYLDNLIEQQHNNKLKNNFSYKYNNLIDNINGYRKNDYKHTIDTINYLNYNETIAEQSKQKRLNILECLTDAINKYEDYEYGGRVSNFVKDEIAQYNEDGLENKKWLESYRIAINSI
jgi:hypothetical protein